MTLNYNKLWKLCIDENLTKTELKNKAGISTSTLAKLSKNMPISISLIIKVCKVFDCDPNDIMEIKREGKQD